MHKKTVFIILGIALLVLIGKFIISNISVFPFLFQLLFNKDIQLKHTDDHVNILLLGTGGGNHEGPNLTDTIILASLDKKDNKATLISIPRDLWSPDLNNKINYAYADGESKRQGGGLIEAKAAVGKITGQAIDYGIRVDFSGFIKAVDIVGGLDINVENTFDDYQYPIDGKESDPCGHSPAELQALGNTPEDQLPQVFPCRYIHLHFDKGLTHMNGETALEFVRSRHASQTIETSDFARSKRQQKVIQAFKNKVLSPQTLINPGKIINLYSILKSSIDTDIQQNEFDDFIRLAEAMKDVNFKNVAIDAGDESIQRPGLLLNPPISVDYGYAWVLIPRIGNGNFSEIQKYIDCQLKSENCLVSKVPLN